MFNLRGTHFLFNVGTNNFPSGFVTDNTSENLSPGSYTENTSTISTSDKKGWVSGVAVEAC